MLFSCASSYTHPDEAASDTAFLKIRPYRAVEGEAHPPRTTMHINKKEVVDLVDFEDPVFGIKRKLKIPSTEAFVKAGENVIDLHITAYNKHRAKFNKHSIEVTFKPRNSYEIVIDVPENLSQTEDLDADSSAVIRLLNTTENSVMTEHEIALKDDLWRSFDPSNDNSVYDSVIQSTVQGIILSQ
jgi:hypothetical protein